jgi:recombination protein RecA
MGKKQSQLEMTVTSIQQRYGTLALAKGRPPLVGAASMVPHIPTSFAALDKALGIGGLARGRVSEILGPTTSGKTTLALKFLAQAQVNGGQVGYVDYAHAFDPDYAYRCGLDLSRLLIATPCDLAEALVTTEALATSGALSALVLDGPDTLCSNDLDSALLAACLDRIVAPLARAATVLLFLRVPVARVDPGLSALAHHAAIRLYITRERWLRASLRDPAQSTAGCSASLRDPAQSTAGCSASLRDQHGDIRGYEGRVEILKNRLGPAGRVVTITIRFNGTVRGEGL